jgi:glycosyltransferase involved in cell wall biosynthesis
MPLFSVVICAYNPRLDYLKRVLAALQVQTLAREQWELVLIDNRSEPALSHDQMGSPALPLRIIREETPGLIAARVRGLQETSGAWIVYVDDDNVLDPDYLEQLQKITMELPQVALWSGAIRPEFETEPSSWTQLFWPYLAIRTLSHSLWSNIAIHDVLPCGAGMAVRRDVMTNWADGMKADKARARLGRNGDSLMAGEDTDIGLVACDMHLGVGLSERLNLIHLIPSRRLERDYLKRLAFSVVYSHTMLDLLRGRRKTIGTFLKVLMYTREWWTWRRSRVGLTLWWCQISAILRAWFDFKTGGDRA